MRSPDLPIRSQVPSHCNWNTSLGEYLGQSLSQALAKLKVLRRIGTGPAIVYTHYCRRDVMKCMSVGPWRFSSNGWAWGIGNYLSGRHADLRTKTAFRALLMSMMQPIKAVSLVVVLSRLCLHSLVPAVGRAT